jgi:hypothetical protein
MYAKLTNGLYELKKENKLYLKRISMFIWASGQKIQISQDQNLLFPEGKIVTKFGIRLKLSFCTKSKLLQNFVHDQKRPWGS